jgi:hypothetical protein
MLWMLLLSNLVYGSILYVIYARYIMDVCDFDCQKNKKLKVLSSAMVTAIQNKEKDPQAYERARTAYYTFKDGQGWVHQEKEKKANETVLPILDSYQKRFDKMKQDMVYQAAVAQAKQDALNSQVGDEDEVRFIHSEIEKEREQASVYKRMQELAYVPVDVYAWLPSFLDLVLGFMILFLAYQLFVQGKLTSVVNRVSQSSG